MIGGQQRPQAVPLTHVSAHQNGPTVILRITRNGVDHHDAPMNAETSLAVMVQIGNSVQGMSAPGQLLEFLREWQRNLEGSQNGA
jgi:hypothetical protein